MQETVCLGMEFVSKLYVYSNNCELLFKVDVVLAWARILILTIILLVANI